MYGRTKVSPRCFLNIDLKKAYDSINWSFLSHVLEGLGFDSWFIHLVMTCVQTARFSFSVNDVLEGNLVGKQGRRQGDPLSPYLFILSIEYLDRLLKHELFSDSNGFVFHPKCGKVKLTHMLFADDLLLFCRGDIGSLTALKRVMDKFSAMSGLEINHRKSAIFTAGIKAVDRSQLLGIWNFPEGSFPVRYLGVPLSPRKLKNSDYESLITKMTYKVQSWSAKHRSYVGRLQLVKAVLLSIQRFWSCIFPIPVGVAKRVEGICRSYLWSGNIDGKKSLVAWKQVCQSFLRGGLQIKEVLGWNRSIIGQMVLKLISTGTSETIWTAWVRAYKLRQDGILQVSCKQSDSPWWKALLKVRDFLMSKMLGFETQLLGIPGARVTQVIYECFVLNAEPVLWYSQVWNPLTSPRISFHYWLVVLRRLPTKDRLVRFGLLNDCVCG